VKKPWVAAALTKLCELRLVDSGSYHGGSNGHYPIHSTKKAKKKSDVNAAKMQGYRIEVQMVLT
jgi:hypothetical protein